MAHKERLGIGWQTWKTQCRVYDSSSSRLTGPLLSAGVMYVANELLQLNWTLHPESGLQNLPTIKAMLGKDKAALDSLVRRAQKYVIANMPDTVVNEGILQCLFGGSEELIANIFRESFKTTRSRAQPPTLQAKWVSEYRALAKLGRRITLDDEPRFSDGADLVFEVHYTTSSTQGPQVFKASMLFPAVKGTIQSLTEMNYQGIIPVVKKAPSIAKAMPLSFPVADFANLYYQRRFFKLVEEFQRQQTKLQQKGVDRWWHPETHLGSGGGNKASLVIQLLTVARDWFHSVWKTSVAGRNAEAARVQAHKTTVPGVSISCSVDTPLPLVALGLAGREVIEAFQLGQGTGTQHVHYECKDGHQKDCHPKEQPFMHPTMSALDFNTCFLYCFVVSQGLMPWCPSAATPTTVNWDAVMETLQSDWKPQFTVSSSKVAEATISSSGRVCKPTNSTEGGQGTSFQLPSYNPCGYLLLNAERGKGMGCVPEEYCEAYGSKQGSKGDGLGSALVDDIAGKMGENLVDSHIFTKVLKKGWAAKNLPLCKDPSKPSGVNCLAGHSWRFMHAGELDVSVAHIGIGGPSKLPDDIAAFQLQRNSRSSASSSQKTYQDEYEIRFRGKGLVTRKRDHQDLLYLLSMSGSQTRNNHAVIDQLKTHKGLEDACALCSTWLEYKSTPDIRNTLLKTMKDEGGIYGLLKKLLVPISSVGYHVPVPTAPTIDMEYMGYSSCSDFVEARKQMAAERDAVQLEIWGELPQLGEDAHPFVIPTITCLLAADQDLCKRHLSGGSKGALQQAGAGLTAAYGVSQVIQSNLVGAAAAVGPALKEMDQNISYNQAHAALADSSRTKLLTLAAEAWRQLHPLPDTLSKEAAIVLLHSSSIPVKELKLHSRQVPMHECKGNLIMYLGEQSVKVDHYSILKLDSNNLMIDGSRNSSSEDIKFRALSSDGKWARPFKACEQLMQCFPHLIVACENAPLFAPRHHPFGTYSISDGLDRRVAAMWTSIQQQNPAGSNQPEKSQGDLRPVTAGPGPAVPQQPSCELLVGPEVMEGLPENTLAEDSDTDYAPDGLEPEHQAVVEPIVRARRTGALQQNNIRDAQQQPEAAADPQPTALKNSIAEHGGSLGADEHVVVKPKKANNPRAAMLKLMQRNLREHYKHAILYDLCQHQDKSEWLNILSTLATSQVPYTKECHGRTPDMVVVWDGFDGSNHRYLTYSNVLPKNCGPTFNPQFRDGDSSRTYDICDLERASIQHGHVAILMPVEYVRAGKLSMDIVPNLLKLSHPDGSHDWTQLISDRKFAALTKNVKRKNSAAAGQNSTAALVAAADKRARAMGPSAVGKPHKTVQAAPSVAHKRKRAVACPVAVADSVAGPTVAQKQKRAVACPVLLAGPAMVSQPVAVPIVVPEPVEGAIVVPEPVAGGIVVPEPVAGGIVVPEPVAGGIVVPEPVTGLVVVAGPGVVVDPVAEEDLEIAQMELELLELENAPVLQIAVAAAKVQLLQKQLENASVNSLKKARLTLQIAEARFRKFTTA